MEVLRVTPRMHAIRYDRYGPPEVFHVADVPKPPLRDGYVMIRVRATSINGGELFAREGKIRLLSGNRFPKSIGTDFTGEITNLGTVRDELSVGDRVWGGLPRDQYVRGVFGSAAEYVCVPPEFFSRAPSNIDLVEAVALPVGCTALIGLRDKARLQAGERLLVRGATGGVGNVAVQLGRSFGAHVTALASAKNLELARTLGADEVFDYRTTSWEDLGKFDVVFDTVGTDLWELRKLQTKQGRMIAIAMNPARLLPTALTILTSSVFGSHRMRFYSAAPNRRLLSELTSLVEAGTLKPLVDEIFSLENYADAHRALAAGGTRGKLVVKID
jgi:NADPH:quinone reductase-like Zn-dependent oxidoreductase